MAGRGVRRASEEKTYPDFANRSPKIFDRQINPHPQRFDNVRGTAS